MWCEGGVRASVVRHRIKSGIAWIIDEGFARVTTSSSPTGTTKKSLQLVSYEEEGRQNRIMIKCVYETTDKSEY